MAMFAIGYWPSYENPDPKSLGWRFGIAHVQLVVGVLLWPVTPVLGIGLAMYGRIVSRSFPWLKVIFVALGSTALFLAFAWLDPTGVLTWFSD